MHNIFPICELPRRNLHLFIDGARNNGTISYFGVNARYTI